MNPPPKLPLGQAPDAVPEEPPMPMVIWVHDGPVCVTIVDPPVPHASSGICHCPACHAHDPDRAVRFY